MGHQAPKIIYSGAIETILTHGGTDTGERFNKTKQFEDISASSKNDEYQNSQDIQNTVI